MNSKKMLVDTEAVALKQKRKFEDFFEPFGGVDAVNAMKDDLDTISANLLSFYQAYTEIYHRCGEMIDNYDLIVIRDQDAIKGQTTIDDFDENGELITKKKGGYNA